MADLQRRLLDFVVQNFMVELEEIELDKSMIDEGIIDSFGLIEISSFLEMEFSIQIAEEDMTRQNFGSILKIVSFVKERMGE
jgi:acyl carrier protein